MPFECPSESTGEVIQLPHIYGGPADIELPNGAVILNTGMVVNNITVHLESHTALLPEFDCLFVGDVAIKALVSLNNARGRARLQSTGLNRPNRYLPI